MTALAYATAGILGLVNVALNVAILRTASYSAGQKAVQSLLIWVLPLLGPFVVWLMWRQLQFEHAHNEQRPDHFADPGAVEGSYSQGASFGGDAGGGGDGD